MTRKVETSQGGKTTETSLLRQIDEMWLQVQLQVSQIVPFKQKAIFLVFSSPYPLIGEHIEGKQKKRKVGVEYKRPVFIPSIYHHCIRTFACQTIDECECAVVMQLKN